MQVNKSFQFAIKSIRRRKLRSGLTMLGIIIGVAAVIVLVSLIQGFGNSVVSSFEKLGSNFVEVLIFPNEIKTIDYNDIKDFAKENNDVIANVFPKHNLADIRVAYNDSNILTDIYGVSETYLDVNSLKMEEGRFFSYLEASDSKTSCVIGSYIRKKFFEDENPIGKKMKINGVFYDIQGVMAENAGNTRGSGDDVIYIPYTSVRYISKDSNIDGLTFVATDTEKLSEAKERIDLYLKDFYGDDKYYMIISVTDVLNELDDIMSLLTVILIGVASISLLVGGIGIMNIMFVSVTERTKEIGIRVAIGATPKDVMLQFIAESITTSSLGGVVGMIVGILISIVSTKLLNVDFNMPYIAILISVLISVGTGVVFGYIPARKAALMNPIDALRSE